MKIITAIPTQAVTGDVTSAAVDKGDLCKVGVHAIFSGSDRAGSLVVQGSNDGTNFADISTTAVTSAADKVVSVKTYCRYVRVFWDNTSGSGNMTAYVSLVENTVKGA